MATRLSLTFAKLTAPDGTVHPRVRAEVKNGELRFTPPHPATRQTIPNVVSNMRDTRNALRWEVTVEGAEGPEVWVLEQEGGCC